LGSARAIIINSEDNVATLVADVGEGEEVLCGFYSIRARQAIPQGHKIALLDLSPGEEITKYGFPIGVASRFIGKGEWVHVHNVVSRRRGQQEANRPAVAAAEMREGRADREARAATRPSNRKRRAPSVVGPER
jgi:altronate hydrolase